MKAQKRSTEPPPVQAGEIGSEIPADVRAAACARALEMQKRKVEAGDAEALLWAIHYVIEGGTTFPQWLGTSVNEAIIGYITHEHSSLDESFGVMRPRGYRRGAENKQAKCADNSNWIVIQLSKHGYPIDDQLFEVVGERFGVKKTTAKKWYYGAKKSNDSVLYAFEQGERLDELPDHLKRMAAQLKGCR
ncbi:hypothetical protein J2X02_003391 [Pseudoxanthomonas japonensis]|uniref:hypothetical protein n=1 Tax=Pseudoxanthomonas japonensis TaxID=69284 RepID=UPI0028664290|nr:hypothetical protein [Pseudoxanthomonas japonensis]MDR7070526.1 hypothetical protein [Pseudoxanthomonas japonensis]